MNVIEDVGRRIGDQFRPDRVILFGAHAEERATADSDVDLLVIMSTGRSPVDESVAICLAIRPPFPMDVLVRTRTMIERRRAVGDPFISEILRHGKLLHEAADH